VDTVPFVLGNTAGRNRTEMPERRGLKAFLGGEVSSKQVGREKPVEGEFPISGF